MFVTLLAGLLLQAAQPAIRDPLAPARAGQVQCGLPDAARKSCRSIGSFFVRPDGKYDNKVVQLLSVDPFITLESLGPVEVKGDAVCSALTPQMMDEAAYLLGGSRPLDANQMGVIRPLLDQQLAPLYGREVCTTYASVGERIVGRVSIAGERQPARDLAFIWVPAGDGWKVLP
jgi:hypothetical protein